jgi:hypothetical protein
MQDILGGEPFAYEEIDVTSGAVKNLTEATYTDAKGRIATVAVIVNKTGTIRWIADGNTTPTTSLGVPTAADDVIRLTSAQAIAKFAAIAESTTAKLHVHYLR